MRIRVPAAIVLAAVTAVVVPASVLPADAAKPKVFVFSGEADRLNVYDAESGKKRTLLNNTTDDPEHGLNINAEICFIPDHVSWKPKDETWFIAGEDTDQNSQPGVIRQGWGIFKLSGDSLATFKATELGKLVPDSFVTQGDNPENYGCGVLPDGRIVTSDVGDQFPQDPATGQLIEWFPKKSHFQGHLPSGRTDFPRVPHCKIDVTIGTAGGIQVDGNAVFVASNRPNLQGQSPGGIFRYNSKIWPTGQTPAKGCSRQDGTGEQLAAANKVGKSVFIPQTLSLTPSDIVDSGNNSYYVSSVFTGTVAEYSKSGDFMRYVLLGTGQVGVAGGVTPFGMGVEPDGTLWVADIGIILAAPIPNAGSVVRVDPEDIPVQQPETIDNQLQFPDGIGILVLPASTGGNGNDDDRDDDNGTGGPDDDSDGNASPVGLPATGWPAAPWALVASVLVLAAIWRLARADR